MQHRYSPGAGAVSGCQLPEKAPGVIQPGRCYQNTNLSARLNDIEEDLMTTYQSLLRVCLGFSFFLEVGFCIRSRRRRSWCMGRRGWQHHIEPFSFQYRSQFGFYLGQVEYILDLPFEHGMSAGQYKISQRPRCRVFESEIFVCNKAYAYNILHTSQALDARCLEEIFE